MLANDMKKGLTGTLINGWEFRIEDNKKGNIRLATVWGFEVEMGSIYVWDIKTVNGPFGLDRIELSKTQIRSKKLVNANGF